MLLQILQNVGIAFAAIIVVTLIKNRNSMVANEFVLSVFWKENRNLWIWTMTLITIIAVVNGYAPESVEVITQYLGLTLTSGPGGFATLAVVLLTTQKATKTLAKKKAQIAVREKRIKE
ncbi:hypothetical protein [Flavobacterium sp.]